MCLICRCRYYLFLVWWALDAFFRLTRSTEKAMHSSFAAAVLTMNALKKPRYDLSKRLVDCTDTSANDAAKARIYALQIQHGINLLDHAGRWGGYRMDFVAELRALNRRALCFTCDRSPCPFETSN